MLTSVVEQPQTALMRRFCSLGDNCELGIAQRAFGAEPADLLRWAAIPVPAPLRLLDAGCAGLGDPVQLRLDVAGKFYWLHHGGYDFGWHSLTRAGSVPEAEMLRREMLRMPRLADALLADLGEAQRIFVIKSGVAPLTLAQALAVRRAMSEFGDAKLMFVTLSEPGHPPGSAHWDAPGVLHGYLARFADDARVTDDTPTGAWLELCQTAAALADLEAA